MEPIDWDRINEELTRCHGPLMRVWNRYRDQMYRRGYVTMDVIQEFYLRVLKTKEQFRDRTRAEFCAWTRTIFSRLILEKLRRHRPESLGSDRDVVAGQQDSPSHNLQLDESVMRDELRQAAYDLARAALDAPDRILIELRFEEKLSPEAVGERLRKDHSQIWNEHPAWSREKELDEACILARPRFDEEFRKVHKLLKDGPPDERLPAK